MTRLHSTINEFLPNIRKVLFPRTKHIDTLTARNLGVEVVLLRDGTDNDELLWGNLTARNSGNDGERAVPLDVGQESVVRILQTSVVDLQ